MERASTASDEIRCVSSGLPRLHAEPFVGPDTDVLYLNLIGRDVLVVNSVDAAIGLFETKSSAYADRVRLDTDV